MIWMLIGIGGALGSMARHALNHLVHQRALGTTFPTGIFLINVIGSAAIGVFAGIFASGRMPLGPSLRTFVVVGFLGGFTTFSSFSLDTLTLIRAGHLAQAIWNVAGQIGLSLVGVTIGYRVGSAI